MAAGSSPDGNARIAQTFSALTSGLLASVELTIAKPGMSEGDYVLRLSLLDSGAPTNAVLAESVVIDASVPATEDPAGVPVIFTFGTPASVVAGTQYALVLTRPGGGLLQWRGGLGDPCTGQSFASPNQTDPFTVLSDGLDLDFLTFVRS